VSSRSGRAGAVAALGAALCLLGGAFATQALYVPGIGLGALALLAACSVHLAAWRGRVVLAPRSARIHEGETLRLRVKVAGWLVPFGGGEVCVPEMPATAHRSNRRAVEFTLRPQRRGARVLGPAIVRYSDPFGVCARERRSLVSELLVLPRVEQLPQADIRRLAGAETLAGGHAHSAAASDVDGLRPYRPGAPASRIHWPTVARTGTLHELHLHEDSERFPMVVLDTLRPASIDALDMAVRAAASLCVALAKEGGCLLLLPSAKHAQLVPADLAGWPELHAQLALVEPGGSPPWRAATGASCILWVSARRPEARGVHRGCVCYTVSPLPAHRTRVLFAACGCAVQLVERPLLAAAGAR
jgi:uncharacterized protein (DUF58 family)